jgi:hypothetical protein
LILQNNINSTLQNILIDIILFKPFDEYLDQMNSLSQYTSLLNRFPKFELSYETVSHKKVSSNDDTRDSIAIAISLGRKYFIWYTYKLGSSEDICYLIGLDKDKQICSVEKRECKIPKDYCFGTVVYGTMFESGDEVDAPHIFIAEDIYYYCGTNLSNLCFGNRIGFLRDYVKSNIDANICLPLMWYVESGKEYTCIIPSELASKIGYTPHHIQYREIRRVAPYVNIAIPKRGAISTTVAPVISSATVAQKITASSIMNPIPRFDFGKPAYRYPAVFNITADPQLDLYHLYAYGGSNVAVYCGLAGIQSFKTSIFMNKIFRHIRENANLDLAEESEDESDFENMDMNKYVNLDVVLPIECVFNAKHKKWIPVRLAKKEEKLIHIEKLVLDNVRNVNAGDNRRVPYHPRSYGNNKERANYNDQYNKSKRTNTYNRK